MIDRLAGGIAKSLRAVEQGAGHVGFEARFAKRGAAGLTGLAMPANGNEGKHDVIALL